MPAASRDQTMAGLLWTPSPERIERSSIRQYMNWLESEHGLVFADYEALQRWSVDDIDSFWATIWEYFQIKSHSPHSAVLGRRTMPGAEWFPGASLNIVEQILRHETSAHPAIRYASETAGVEELSWAELRQQAASVAAHLRNLGVKSGDRVAAYSTNTPETVVAFLAVASIGAIWSLCSPDMGMNSILDRFRQIEPVALFAVSSNTFQGKTHARTGFVSDLMAALPSVQHLIHLPPNSPGPAENRDSGVHWQEILGQQAELKIAALPFDHPLWILYSSGTTGLPKPIIHGHGGITLELIKSMGLHLDLGPGDVFSWYTSCAWVMWNISIGALLCGATVAIYDGSPAFPDLGALWKFAGAAQVTAFGNGAAFYGNCMKAGIKPRETADLSRLKYIGSTGSPLSEDAYGWIYAELGPDIWLAPISGGTDFSNAFVGGCPLLPVYSGEMQCCYLGCDIQVFDEEGNSLQGAVGELVCAQPIPSMPLYFWNDQDGTRYRNSYFDVYPGIWRHGDWMSITPRGGVIIYGRSDATINRHGVRMGTVEIYQAVEAQPEVLDSLIIDLEYLGRESYMPLFVVLREGEVLEDFLKQRINNSIRESVSPRFLPNEIFQVEQVPRTLSGKKLEIPIRKILLGQPADKVANPDTITNPESLAWYVNFAEQLVQPK